MPDSNDAPVLRKSYLIILVIAVILLPIINRDIRRGIRRKLRPRDPVKVKVAGKNAPSTGKLGHKTIAAIRKDIEAFNSWVLCDSNAPAAIIEIVPESAYSICRLDRPPFRAKTLRFGIQGKETGVGSLGALRRRLRVLAHDGADGKILDVVQNDSGTGYVASVEFSGSGRIGLSIDEAPAVYYSLDVRELWPLSVNGTFLQNEEWAAVVGTRFLKVGDTIPPHAKKCGYEVLSVSPRSVWLAAIHMKDSKLDLPPLDFADPVAIRMSQGGRLLRPKRLELGSGRFFAAGDEIPVPQSNAHMMVQEIWSNPDAVHFIYRPSDGDEIVDLLCVILR